MRISKKLIATLCIIPMTVNLGLCLGNYYSIAQDGKDSMPFVTYSSVDKANVTTQYGFGVKAQVFNKDNETADDVPDIGSDGITTTSVYNETAGTIETWDNKITKELFEKYKSDLEIVNGAIVNTEICDGFVNYTFSNNKILKVNLTDTGIEDTNYEHSVDSDSKIIEEYTDENDVAYKRYENGVVVIEKQQVEGSHDIDMITIGSESMKLNYSISVGNILIHYFGLCVIEVIAALVGFGAYKIIKNDK
jgi:hypothetical protein